MRFKPVRAWGVALFHSAWLLVSPPLHAQEAPPPPSGSVSPSSARSLVPVDPVAALLAGIGLRSGDPTAALPPALPPITSCQAHCAAARDHQAGKRWVAALQESARAIEADPSATAAYDLRAELFGARNLSAHIVATYADFIAAVPENPRPWCLRGYYRCLEGDHVGGMADFDEALRLAGGSPEWTDWIRNYRANAACRIGDDRRGVAEYDDLFRDGSIGMNDLRNRLPALIRLGEFGRAVADAERLMATKVTPQHRFLRGSARLRAGRFADAVADLDQSRVDFPKHIETQCTAALALFAAGRQAEAIALLDRLLAESPPPDRMIDGTGADGQVQTARGWAALLTGDFARAQALLTRAAGAPDGRLMIGATSSSTLWKDRSLESTMVEFEARCRVAPSIPWAFVLLQGPAARSEAHPRREFIAALVCRVVPDPSVAPLLVVYAVADHPDQPWKGHAVLGELIASACLRDRAKLAEAVDNLRLWARGPESLAESLAEEFGP